MWLSQYPDDLVSSELPVKPEGPSLPLILDKHLSIYETDALV